MIVRSLVLGLAALATAASAAPPLPGPPPPAPPPRLVIMMTVDGLTADMFDRHRPLFTGGLARISGGTWFRNGQPPTGPRQVETIVAALKQRSPPSVVVAADGNSNTSPDLQGSTVDQRWYWDGVRFTASTRAPVPRIVPRANSAIAGMIASSQPGLVPPAGCLPAGGTTGSPAVPQRFARPAGDAQAFAASPAMDGAVLAFAAALAQELQLGADDAPDLLSLGLPATGRVARRHGSTGEITCLQLLSLDRDLGGFLAVLDRNRIDYAVVLASTAPTRVPVIFWRAGMPASVRSETVATNDIMPTLAAMLGLRLDISSIDGNCLTGIQGIACPPR